MNGSPVSREEWECRVLGATVEIGECLEWTGATVGKVPVVYTPAGFLREGVGGGRQSARVAYWVIQRGKHPGDGKVLTPTCGNPRCLAHLKPMRRGAHMALAGQRGDLSSLSRTATTTKTARARGKLTEQKAQEIRASSESTAALALRFGVARQTVQAVRRGTAWAEGVQGASVFSWRPAA